MGRIEGVVTARAAWKGRVEVVELTFDPAIVSYEDLVRAADGMGCATAVYAHDDEQLAAAQARVGDRALPLGEASTDIENADAHQFRHLRATPMIHLPLTEAQANKVNASLQADRDATRWLSPRQLDLLRQIEAAIAAKPDALDGLIFPSDPALLRAYADTLSTRLNGVTADGASGD
ncbi:MAG: hypothetical protein AAGA29_01745 [Planctomycetota bacterium]